MANDRPKITPSEGYVLIKITDADKPKEGGWRSVDPNPMPQRGEVVAIGADTIYPGLDKVFKCPVKMGDKIIHSGAGFENIVIDGSLDYRFVPFTRILGVQNDE